jgi:pimeloyl-ACP methyl ester carboxylesterase
LSVLSAVERHPRDATAAQNEQRRALRLTLPVLAVSAAASGGGTVGKAMKFAVDDVQSVITTGCGHFVAEEAPEAMPTALAEFLAP